MLIGRKIVRKKSSFTDCSTKNINVTNKQISTKLIDIKADVLAALNSNGPIVALESTIITHGMPYPCNLETAIAVENTVRNQVNEIYFPLFIVLNGAKNSLYICGDCLCVCMWCVYIRIFLIQIVLLFFIYKFYTYI